MCEGEGGKDWMVGESSVCGEEFCYLGDMIGAGGGAGASSVARVRSGWKRLGSCYLCLSREGCHFEIRGSCTILV